MEEVDARSDVAMAGSDDGSDADLVPVTITVSTLAGTFGCEEAIDIRVSHDATVGQMKARLKASSARPFPQDFWEDKVFCMGYPPEAFECRRDYKRIMQTLPVRAAMKKCTGSPITLMCSIVRVAPRAPADPVA